MCTARELNGPSGFTVIVTVEIKALANVNIVFYAMNMLYIYVQYWHIDFLLSWPGY